VSGSPVTVLALTKFTESLTEAQQLFKRDAKKRDSLEKALVAQIHKLAQMPTFAQWEPQPKNCHLPEKLEFRKLEFGINGLTGALSQWRLMYFYMPPENKLWLFWLYSHTQHPIRPSAQELFNEIRQALKEVSA
jgi:hypothetical protein